MQARLIPHHRLKHGRRAGALRPTALIGSAAPQPAAAAQGIYDGGSTLLSLAARQVFDCYPGASSPVTTCTVGAFPTITAFTPASAAARYQVFEKRTRGGFPHR
jgi:hypothetical protein